MSAKRELIVDAIVSALTTITVAASYLSTVDTVSTVLPENWGEPEPGKCPYLLVLDGNESAVPVAMEAAADDNDWQAEMKILIACCIYSNTSTFKAARNNLILDIKKVMLNDADVTRQILWVSRIDIANLDYGMAPKFNHFNLEFTLAYGFDHTVGG